MNRIQIVEQIEELMKECSNKQLYGAAQYLLDAKNCINHSLIFTYQIYKHDPGWADDEHISFFTGTKEEVEMEVAKLKTQYPRRQYFYREVEK